MKIRLQGNSIRFRLKEPEVSALAKNGSISETVQLGVTDALQFTVELCDALHTSVILRDTTIRILLPQSSAVAFTEGEQVGIETKIDFGNGASLLVLIEKDFACLHKSDADNSGTYANPLAIG